MANMPPIVGFELSADDDYKALYLERYRAERHLPHVHNGKIEPLVRLHEVEKLVQELFEDNSDDDTP
jgi:hypothetical protein